MLLSHFRAMEKDTSHCDGFLLQLCVSYGGRGEVVNACRQLAKDVAAGDLSVGDITEEAISKRLLTEDVADPDLLIRTSGECRLSNFLLWQLAYSEMLFLDKCWPEVEQTDFMAVLEEYSRRKRRFGK